MLDEASRAGAANARWVRMRAEELPGDLGPFRMVTFAQSFHWFDRPLVALLRRTAPDGRFSERMREIVVDIWRP